MPKAMEEALLREAKKKDFSKERTDAYVYGTMRKMGWTPKKRKRKSSEADRKRIAKMMVGSKR